MVTWGEFTRAAPELAALGEGRFRETGLIMLGSLRSSGWPRITPVEPRLVDGELQLGMMWQSRKAHDLLRDPRCTVHSATTDKDGTEGDFKVYGTAENVTDPGRRERHCQVTFDEIGWRPEDDHFHLFSIDIQEIAYARFGGGRAQITTWLPGQAPERVSVTG